MAKRNTTIELAQSSANKKAYIYIAQDEIKRSILMVDFYKQPTDNDTRYDVYADIKYIAGDKTQDTINLTANGKVLAKPHNYELGPFDINIRLTDGVKVKKLIYSGVEYLVEAVMDVKEIGIYTTTEPIVSLKDEIYGFEVGEHPVKLSIM